MCLRAVISFVILIRLRIVIKKTFPECFVNNIIAIVTIFVVLLAAAACVQAIYSPLQISDIVTNKNNRFGNSSALDNGMTIFDIAFMNHTQAGRKYSQTIMSQIDGRDKFTGVTHNPALEDIVFMLFTR